MWRDLSYRFRLPLSLVATALFTALVIGVVIVWHTYQNVRVELIDNTTRLGHALASALQPALLHDDLWLAYSILRGPRSASAGSEATLVLLDGERRIVASNLPRRFPVARLLVAADPALAGALGAIDPPAEQVVFDLNALPDRLFFSAPITADGVSVGELLLVYPSEVLWPRFASIVEQGGWSVLLVLAVIVPVGWISGQRLVLPLTRLAACLVRVREEDLERIECAVVEGDDEVGQLNRRFQELLEGLREKAQLEHQMVTNERLAAIGRLAAGVAHEINNPLGGMLLAIDTMRERGIANDHTERTLSLLERGLTQIQDTVSALLVEARREPHSLTTQDIEDTRTLVSIQAGKRTIRMEWDNRVVEPLPLPSTLVRQVLINLLLNAVQSAPRGARVTAAFHPDQTRLSVSVSNEGAPMDTETLDHLFEPYFSRREGGSGLGLWVTYQIVQQLGGQIQVTSRAGETRFSVTLPFPAQEVQSHAA